LKILGKFLHEDEEELAQIRSRLLQHKKSQIFDINPRLIEQIGRGFLQEIFGMVHPVMIKNKESSNFAALYRFN